MKSIKFKKFNCFILTILLVTNVFSQSNTRTEIQIPDILGYTTLKCDLHMHTVFSDGKVWPTVRLEEAWREGLDVISITDHVEYLPHKNDIIANRNRSNEIAVENAAAYGIIVIPGAEVTRNYPFGHHNTLFIKDVELLNEKEDIEALKQAKKQDAFIVWNHPGWRRENEIPIWTDAQTEIFDNDMMNGIEIVNGNSYYPLAHKWAIEKHLTMVGNTDIHNPIGMNYDLINSHRPMTLVFVKVKTTDGVRDALDNGRTAVYVKDTLIGSIEYLKPIFEKSVKISNTELKMKDGAMWQSLDFYNNSDIPFHMKRISEIDSTIGLSSGMYLPPHRTVKVIVKGLPGIKEGKQVISVKYLVENLYIGPREGMPVEIKFSVEYTGNN